MKKIKVPNHIVNLCRNQKKYEIRVANTREKLILNAFVFLADEIEKEYFKADEIKNFKDKITEIIDGKFKTKLQQTLFHVATLNINQFIDYFQQKVFNRTLNLEQIQGIKSKLLDKFLNKYVGESVTNISSSVKEILNSKISQYTQDGLNFNDMVKQIVVDTKGTIGKKRARIIARTETAKAIGETNFQTAYKAGLKNKTWIHAGGGKTNRKSHLALHGVTIKITKYFDVPAENQYTPATKMRFPRDPLCREAGHIVNCYCQINYS